MTRTLFTLGELTLADPEYTGPFFDLDKIAKEVNDKVNHMTFFFFPVLVAQTFKKWPKILGLASSHRQCQYFRTHLLLCPLLVSVINSWILGLKSGLEEPFRGIGLQKVQTKISANIWVEFFETEHPSKFLNETFQSNYLRVTLSKEEHIASDQIEIPKRERGGSKYSPINVSPL